MNSDLIGLRATVSITIYGPDRPGEVEVRTDRGTLSLVAYADEKIPRHALVTIYENRSSGVEVLRA